MNDYCDNHCFIRHLDKPKATLWSRRLPSKRAINPAMRRQKAGVGHTLSMIRYSGVTSVHPAKRSDNLGTYYLTRVAASNAKYLVGASSYLAR
jgi:hypothetical protein